MVAQVCGLFVKCVDTCSGVYSSHFISLHFSFILPNGDPTHNRGKCPARSPARNLLVNETTLQPAQQPSQGLLRICGSGVLDGLRAGSRLILEPGAGTWPRSLAEALSSPRARGPQHQGEARRSPAPRPLPPPGKSPHARPPRRLLGTVPIKRVRLRGDRPRPGHRASEFSTAPQPLGHCSHGPGVSPAFLYLTMNNRHPPPGFQT